MKKESNEWSISYKQLGLIIASFSLGLIAALLISNSQAAAQTNFTTTELIGFVLSVILSGASIVLAISAIALGKVSEQSVIERSDESIRLQNEVFVKTTEALQRIEASTGVTEKRIEDIISGRVGDISHRIAELTSSTYQGKRLSPEELEKEIRKSIMEEVRTQRDPEQETERMRKRKERAERYERFHQAVISSFANRQDSSAIKLGHGKFGGDGLELFDGVYQFGDVSVGVSAFGENIKEFLSDFSSKVAKAISDGVVNSAILAVDDDESKEEEAKQMLNESLNIYKGNMNESISVIVGDKNAIVNKIAGLDISNKKFQPTAESDG
ncbi:hypothetical protein OI845_004382 [Vibrio fluvialis]|nr:hypothetical protein [Vibrio fluvialis]